MLEEIPQRSRLHVKMAERLPVVTIPRRSVEQSLIALVRNAFEASDSESEVRLSIGHSGDILQFAVVDSGKGMPPETLRRIGEPFFTTKQPGKGMGLGTFLARTLSEQLGGQLIFESTQGSGTTATLELPTIGKQEIAHAHG